MTCSYDAEIRSLAQPLAPLPTGETPHLTALPEIKAAVFDVYGTMLVSGSGDVGTAFQGDVAAGRAAALVAAAAACECDISETEAAALVERLKQTIQAEHARLKAAGTVYPEIDIRRMWQAVWRERGAPGSQPGRELDWERLALEYEMRVNPVWPMPGIESLLTQLVEGGVLLGIVSNAQCFTPWVLEVLLGHSPAELGFRENLQFYSYRYDAAKPGSFLYEMAADALLAEGIEPKQTIYIGNDMLNDVLPAAQVGFRTALFAGDKRSLRWREGDPRVAGVRPDIVITELSQLAECIFS